MLSNLKFTFYVAYLKGNVAVYIRSKLSNRSVITMAV
jgi:hypothetical protein